MSGLDLLADQFEHRGKLTEHQDAVAFGQDFGHHFQKAFEFSGRLGALGIHQAGMAGDLPQAVIEITSSRFWFQKRPTRHSHGLYIGQARRFVLKGSHVKGTDLGHQVKSRALENYILYNRIEEVDRC